MNEAHMLQQLKSDLERHFSLKGSCLQGNDWEGKMKRLESEYFNLKIKLFDSQIADLTAAKERLKIRYEQGARIW